MPSDSPGARLRDANIYDLLAMPSRDLPFMHARMLLPCILPGLPSNAHGKRAFADTLDNGAAMSFNPKKRDASWQMIQPGCYVDPVGFAHLFPDEILAFLQALYPDVGFDPNSKADYDLVVKVYQERMRALYPGANFKFVRHEREEN